ncbi:hypothetical protein VPH35_107804 [Triticum aestivum]
MVVGGGRDARSRTQVARGRRQKAASLPLDVLVDIAARTDPSTFVRCAATCVDMRCRVKEYISLRGPLRLQHGDRFVLPLLRGNLIYQSQGWLKPEEELFLVDTSAPDATKLRKANRGGFPLSSRDGLVLPRVGLAQELRVCDPATGRSLTLPSEQGFPRTTGVNYVLLVCGDDKGATSVGRHFQVIKAYLQMSQYSGNLQLQTFSSEHGVWGLYTNTYLPNLISNHLQQSLGKALVTGDTVHWLCLTDTGSYVLKLRVRQHRRPVAMCSCSSLKRTRSAWAQSKHTGNWQQRPHVVINMTEKISRFVDKAGGSCISPTNPVQFKLIWFAEKSGTVLIDTCRGFFWLDLQSMEIVRWFLDHRIPYTTHNIPYEMSLTAWVPTFSSTL